MRGIPILAAVCLWGGNASAQEVENAYPRSQGELKALMHALEPVRGPSASMRNEFISRLKQVRLLAGAPFEAIQVDERLTGLAYACAVMTSKMGSRTPDPVRQPWMSDEEFALAQAGVREVMYTDNATDPANAVDRFMSQASSGYTTRQTRFACLNPSLLKTGFSRTEELSAMHYKDTSNLQPPEWDFLAWPARGYMSIVHFNPTDSWSVVLNENKYDRPDASAVKVKLRTANRNLEPAGKPLTMRGVTVMGAKSGTFSFDKPEIRFVPARFKPRAGAIYHVEIEGLQKTDGTAETLRYIVHFVDLKRGREDAASAATVEKYFQEFAARIEAMTDPSEKILALSELISSPGFRKAERAVQTAAKKSHAALLKDKAVKREFDAWGQYCRVYAQEKAIKDNTSRLRATLRSYQQVGQAFPDTRGGKWAERGSKRILSTLQ